MIEHDKKQIKTRIEQLKRLIHYHRYLYHVLDRQEISAEALDSLKKELFDLEQKHPEFITPDSPTQRVGGEPQERFHKTRHVQPMLSINDAFSEKDMHDWLERNAKLLTKEEISQIDFYCELKLDGLAIELIYEKASLKTGSTRGDGIIGEDITQNLKTIEAIPLKLKTFPKSSKEVVARGEVFITKKNFAKVNQAQKKAGLPIYANPRNLAAGSVRQLDPKITAQRFLDSYIYDLVTDLGAQTHEEKHKILKTLGLKTNPHNKFCKNLRQVFEFFEEVQKIREKLPYEIDGIVVNINSNKIFKKLGAIGKAPRGVIALKFPLKQATTRIKDIKIQVGRTGALTPVALLEPIKVGGVTISRATLHNEEEIARLGVRRGDTVIIGRAGDVIPDIIKVLPELRTGKEKKFEMPKQCPVCGGRIVKSKGEVVSRCVNLNCLARQTRYLDHFVSRTAFNIEGLGPKIMDQFLDAGLIQDPADLFSLREGDLIPLERWGEKSAANLIKSIQKSKRIELARFIYSLGIRNVGEETAYDLARIFKNLNALKKASLQELETIMDIGPIVARSIYNWLRNKKNLRFLEKLKKTGVRIKSSKPGLHQGKALGAGLKGKVFVLTGTLKSMTRDEAREKIRDLGGNVSSDISSNTDFLVFGRSPGSKLARAKKLGLKILSEKVFLTMLQ